MARPTNPSDWYAYTSDITGFTSLATQLVSLWVYRYPLIVQNSNRGEDCPWAGQARRLGLGERQALRTLLERQRDLAIRLLGDLDLVFDDETATQEIT